MRSDDEHATSFDIDLPTECDDEYWMVADPELAFKQPPGKPSMVAFFNCHLRLLQILAFAMRTIVRVLLVSSREGGIELTAALCVVFD